MHIAILDADLLYRKKHRFPNLACMKISAYYKAQGHEVSLYQPGVYDKVFISKVFTDTPDPPVEGVRGGSGYFFDKATPLPPEIEHHMPDYHLYDPLLPSLDNTQYYTNYSIGFLTRGCFRKCPFCINQNYTHVIQHSPLEEFYDPTRKKICLLDDNFFGYPKWKELLLQLQATKKPFQFKQGLDERLLTDEKCEILFQSKYDGDYIFAFDNIKDYDLIHSKLKLIRKHTDSTQIKFYVLCGFESTDATDIANTFKRISLLQEYSCCPYIMRYQNKDEKPYLASKWSSIYVSLARWCNQPALFKKNSFREFIIKNQEQIKTSGYISTPYKIMLEFEKEYPDIASQYFDRKYQAIN